MNIIKIKIKKWVTKILINKNHIKKVNRILILI